MVVQNTQLYKRRRKKVAKFPLVNKSIQKLLALMVLGLISVVIFPNEVLIRLGEINDQLMTTLNFKVEDVLINGTDKLDKKALVKVADIELGSNIMTSDINQIKLNLETLPWIRDATVERVLPNKIVITINEEVPQAIFKEGGNYYYINNKGKIIEKIEGSGKLPTSFLLVSGMGANSKFRGIVDELYNFQSIYKLLESLSLKNGRRWDVKLKNNFLLELPETGIREAIEVFEQNFDNSLRFKNICTVDLRLIPDKIYLKMAAN